jgi:hypothetical protein
MTRAMGWTQCVKCRQIISEQLALRTGWLCTACHYKELSGDGMFYSKRRVEEWK